MVMKLKDSVYGSLLNGSEDNNLLVNDIEPMYKLFLEHLKKDRNSYILEMDNGDNGFPLYAKYYDRLLGHRFDTRVSSGHRISDVKKICKTKKRRISTKSKVKFNEFVNVSGLQSSLGNNTQMANSMLMGSSEFLKIQDEDNREDDSYQLFLNDLKVQDGLFAMIYNSILITYEEDEGLMESKNSLNGCEPMPLGLTQPCASHMPAIEDDICSNELKVVLYESCSSPDVIIYEEDDKLIAPFDSCNLSPFDLKLMEVLSKPFDECEYKALWNQANLQKPVQRHKDLRNQIKSFSMKQMGLSYLDHFPVLASKLMNSDAQQSLSLLRGFFFWLKNLCHEGAHQPWVSESSKRIDVSDDDVIILSEK